MQLAAQRKPPVGVIFDSDMGDRIDSVLTLALLYGLQGKDEARVVSLSVSRSDLKAAAFCDAIARFYSGAVNASFASLGRTLPVGLSDDGRKGDETPMMEGVLGKKNASGEPAYAQGIESRNDTSEVSALIRNALTSQYDQNAIVLLTGPATNLARSLKLHGVKELISSKVRFLAVAGGSFAGGGAPEYNIKTDIPAARKLFAEWPTPIVVSGSEIGDALPFPASSIEQDFAWAPNHPVADAYRAYQGMPYDAPTWGMTAALYAIRPDENYFKLSETGNIQVLDDGRLQFKASPEGRHRYLILDPAQKERILTAYTELASAKPVVRRRFRPK
jgi:inosine-uridine nucleoside N-ribohydrolase